MGLRAASVRLSNASVMAPALTEANQSQSFKLTKNSRLESISPVNGHSHNGGCSPLVEERDMCKQLEPLVTPSHNGKNVCDALDNLNTLAFASEIAKVNDKVLPEKSVNSASASDLSSKEELNMNNCPSHMDDQDTMGLQKPTEMSLLKEKTTISNNSEMEQLLRTVMQGSELSSSQDLANVEDFMQVLKTMDVTGQTPNESDGAFPITGLGSFCQSLLNDVDVLNMEEVAPEEHMVDQDETIVSSEEIQTQETLNNLKKEQVKLERRYDFLLRRLQKLQARGMVSHVGNEVAGLFEHTYRLLKHAKDKPPSEDSSSLPSELLAPSEVAWPEPKKDVKIKGLSAASMKNFIHKLEKTKLLQSNAMYKNKTNHKYFGAGSIDTSQTSVNLSKNNCVALPSLTQESRQDLERVAGLLQTEVGIIQQQLDSDATASSSGAESCDEMQNFNNPQQQYCSIAKRASWRWAQDRAAIATRWTWLQWQISDLEYRIRQLNELHKQTRTLKGTVVFGGTSGGGGAKTSASSVTSSPGSVNGYRGLLPGQTKTTTNSSLDELWFPNGSVTGGVSASSSNVNNNNNINNSGSSSGSSNSGGGGGLCARTRPFVKSAFRNRRLLMTTGLHLCTKKWKPTTVKCNCVPGIAPCVLCTGRQDPTYPKESPDLTTVQEQIAYLDAGFHPKISFPEDVNQSFHYDALTKTPEWQQKTARCMTKALKLAVKPERPEKVVVGEVRTEGRVKKPPEFRRKYNKLLKPSTACALTAKIKNRIARGRKPNRKTQAALLARLNRKRPADVAFAQLQALSGNDADADGNDFDEYEAGTSGSIHPSPAPSPPLLAGERVSFNREYRRSRVDSYDIDNIVIPYSVAASTRVEKLPYKEILTPKWRVIDTELIEAKNNGIKLEVPENEDEDMSEEALLVRHEKCELEERRKFLSYMKFPLSGSRSRANRRTDSRAESSGANTPDPMSPHTADTQEASVSPLTSPPATPMTPAANDETLVLNNSIGTLRRRTISQSRWAKEREVRDDNRCATPDHVDVPPYDNREFPLADEVYDKMLDAMPAGHPVRTELKCDSEFVLQPLSLDSESSTDSILGEGEDPNDPEWMVVRRNRDRPKR